MRHATIFLLGSLLLVGLPALAQEALGQKELAPEEAAAPAAAPAETSDRAAAGVLVPEEAFVNANAAYETGAYGRAIELYVALLDRGYENGHVHYNLGNAYLRNGELGRAIASYRRAQLFLPRDQDVMANLAFARKSTKDALAPPEPGPVLSTLFFWHYGLSRAELGTALVVLNVLFWAILVLRVYRRGSEVLRWVLIVLLLLVLAVGVSFAVHLLVPAEVAVVVPQEIEVRSGTSVDDLVLFKLHAGTEVRVVDRREGAVRIALPEDGEGVRGGWIAAEEAELVRR
jgi:hypothetical protein